MKILCWGWWKNSGNLGDVAIWHGIRKLFHNHRLYTMPSGWRNRLQAINSVDLVMVTGGTPFFDYGHLQRTIHVLMPKILRKPLVLFGVGMKPIETLKGRLLIRKLIEHANLITVRDPVTKTMMQNLGVKKEITVTGDSSMVLQPEKVPCKYHDFVLAVPRHLSLDYKRHYHQKLSATQIEIVKKWMRARLEGETVVWMPFHADHYDDDMKIINELNQANQPVIRKKLSPEHTLYLISKATKVVGLRLHSLILSYMQNVKFETYPYDVKISGFQQLIQNYSLNEMKNRILNAALMVSCFPRA